VPAVKADRIGNLDGFRGLCALAVFIYHLFAHIRYTAFMPQGSWQENAYLVGWAVLQPLSTFAVIGFFVLSGFVITLYIRRDIMPEGKYVEFLFFRFTRLASVCAPATLVSVVLAYVYQTLHPGTPWPRYYDYNFWSILASMTGFGREWNWPGWTLIIEWTFYILVALVGALSRPTLANLVVAAACAAFLFWGGALVEHQALMLPFFLGAGLVYLREGVRDHGMALGVTGLALTVGLLCFPQYLKGYDNVLLKSVPMALLVLSFATLPNRNTRLSQTVHYLGKISFSLYIWHWPVILFGNYYLLGSDGAYNWWETAMMFTVYPPVVWLVSHWSYYVFERNYKLGFLLRPRPLSPAP
jgi:peptidoglycan/LPS O-acetylase OafA/YrhL